MGKTLVIYYSAQGHTKRAAEIVAKTLGADLFEIPMDNPYTEEDLDWNDPDSRCNRDWNSEIGRDEGPEKAEVPNWDEYDTVVLGYPIWYAFAAFPMSSFVGGRDFKGKTIYPFCTSHSSDVGDSDIKLKYIIKPPLDEVNWYNAVRFFQDAPETEIADWAKSLK